MKTLLAIFIGIMIPATVSAHGSGASLERVVGDYWVDIGYDPIQPMGKDRMVFDFNLAGASATSTPVDFDYVWVRLQSESRTLLAAGVHRAEIGPTTLLVSLPHDTKGFLNLSVRYQRGDTALAEAAFDIPVTPYEDSRWWRPFAGIGIAGVVCGAMVVFLWKKLRRGGDTL